MFFTHRFLTPSIAERREMILYGNGFRSLLTLSVPTLLMAFVQALIPLSDGIFLNRLGGAIVASAVGYCQPIINMINALSQGLAVAAMAIIGQLNGQGKMSEVRHVASQIMLFSFGLGTLMAPLSVIMAFFLSKQVNPALSSAVMTYLSLYAMVIPLLFLAAIFNAIKNATGQPEASFYRMLLLLLAKLLFNSLFLYVFRLAIVGAVLASLMSYILIAIWMYYDLFLRESESKLSIKGYIFDKNVIRQLLKLGIPSIISSVMINLGFFLINIEIEQYGTEILNAQTIAANLNSLSFTLPAALSTTVTTMVAMKCAVGQNKAARKTVWQAIAASLAIAALMIALFIPAAPLLVSLFTDHPFISATASAALNIYTLSVIGFAVFMVVQAAFIGLGRTKVPMIAGILRIWLFRYAFILLAKKYFGMGYEAVFWANLFSNFLAALIFLLYLMGGTFKSALSQDESKSHP